MCTYILGRLALIFTAVLVVITATSLGIYTEFDKMNGFSLNMILNQVVYYIPHALFSSFVIFYSVFFYKKKDSTFNKNLSNHFSMKMGWSLLVICFFAITILGINFYLNEVILPSVNISSFSYNRSELDSQMRKSENKQISSQLEEIIKKVILGDYSKSLALVSKQSAVYQDTFLSTFLSKVLRDYQKSDEILVANAKKRIKNFDKAYSYYLNDDYYEARRFFNKKRYRKIGKYFIHKMDVAKRYKTLKNKKDYHIQELVQLGETGFANEICTRQEYIKYLQKLNRLYPNSYSIEKKFREYKLDLVFLGDDKMVENRSFELSHPLKQKLFFIDNNLRLPLKTKQDYLFGETFILFNQIFTFEKQVYLKDMIILSNLTDDTPPAYKVSYGRWEGNRIHISELKNLIKSQKRIQDRKEGYLKLSEAWDFNQLIFINKVIKNASKVSIFDLKKFYDLQVDKKYTSPMFAIYIIEKLSYYGASLILFFIFALGGVILRTRFEKAPNWLSRIFLSISAIALCSLSFYAVKEIVLVALS